MVIYNTKEEAKAVLRNKELPFGASIILNTKDGDLLGVQGKSKMKFLDMNTLPPTDGKSNQVLKLDENGNVVWANDDMRDIVDDLTSTDTDKALSANMGRELNEIKINKSIFDAKIFLVGSNIVSKNGTIRIHHSTSTYSSAEDEWKNSTIYSNFPEASVDSNGLLSVDHYNLLANIVTKASTSTNGINFNHGTFTHEANQVYTGTGILYKNSTGEWTSTTARKVINAATTTTAGVMTAADKVKLENTVSTTTKATSDTLGLVKQAADLTDLQTDTDLEGVKAQFNQLLANLRAAGIMYQTPQP